MCTIFCLFQLIIDKYLRIAKKKRDECQKEVDAVTSSYANAKEDILNTHELLLKAAHV